jgi:hypothetical protein
VDLANNIMIFSTFTTSKPFTKPSHLYIYSFI